MAQAPGTFVAPHAPVAMPSHPPQDDYRPSSERQCRSNSGRSFSSATSEWLRELYCDTCWFCEAPTQLDCAHVIPVRDNINFTWLFNLGLVSLNRLGDFDNALPLCTNCHLNFDHQYRPRLIIYPYHLAFFLEKEQRWQRDFPITKHRRPIPTITEYQEHCERQHDTSQGIMQAVGGLYMAFMDINFLPPSSLPCRVRLRQWHGDPMAMIYRAIQAAVRITSPVLLPESIRDSLLHLHALYEQGNQLLKQEWRIQAASLSHPPGPADLGLSISNPYFPGPGPHSRGPGPLTSFQAPPSFSPAATLVRPNRQAPPVLFAALPSLPSTTSPTTNYKRKRSDSSDPSTEHTAKRGLIQTPLTTEALRSLADTQARADRSQEVLRGLNRDGGHEGKPPEDGQDVGENSFISKSPSDPEVVPFISGSRHMWRWCGPSGTSTDNIERWKRYRMVYESRRCTTWS